MSALLLTEEERQRFADYLEQESVSSDGIAQQMEATFGPPGKVLARQEREYSAAAMLIVKRLRSSERFTMLG